MTKVNIFMDDLRPCPVAPNWLLALDAESTLRLLAQHRGNINILSLDHDLGDTSIPEKHGKWMVNRMIEQGLYADIIYLHTANGEGRKNMHSYLLQAQEHGALPPHVKIYNSPMPWFNLATGELLED